MSNSNSRVRRSARPRNSRRRERPVRSDSGAAQRIVRQHHQRRASTGKVSICHRTGSGTYQSIEISASAETAHREHGDAKIGEPVPGDTTKVFDQNCRPVGASVSVRKSTNGADANDAPGPTIAVGAAVNWTYEVTNTGTVALTGVAVVDDRGVRVTCGGAALAVGQSMTCTGSGVATPGQYRNVGTVTANWTGGRSPPPTRATTSVWPPPTREKDPRSSCATRRAMVPFT